MSTRILFSALLAVALAALAGCDNSGSSGSSSGSSTTSSGSTSGSTGSTSGTSTGGTTGSSSGSTGGSTGGSTSGSTGSAATASVTGYPGFSAADETGGTFTSGDGGHDLSYVEVDVTDVDHGDLCAATSPVFDVGERILTVDVERAPGVDVVPGTYLTSASPFDGGKGEVIDMLANDAGSVDIVRSGTGSVTLTTVDLAGSAGSFDVTFTLPDAGSEAVHGTFSGVPLCHTI